MTRTTARALGLAAVLLASAAAAPMAQVQPPAAEPPPPATTLVRPTPQTDAELEAMLAGLGFTDLRVTDSDRRSVEFTARDADGRRVELEVARFGILVEIEVKDNRPAAQADLIRLLPPPAQDAARQAGIADLREFDRSRRGMKLEGLNAEGREVETRLEADGRAMMRGDRGAFDRDERGGPLPPAEVRRVVERAGYAVSGDIEFRRGHAAVVAKNPEGETVEVHVERGGQIVREMRRLDLE